MIAHDKAAVSWSACSGSEVLRLEDSKKKLAASGRLDKPVATEILPLGAFYPAEDYHQDYYKESPVRYKFYRYNSGRDQYLDKNCGEDLHPDWSSFHSTAAQRYRKPSDEE